MELSRLGRNTADLGRLLDDLDERGIGLTILNLGVDTATASGPRVTNERAQQVLGETLTARDKLVINHDSGATVIFEKATGRGVKLDANNRLVGFRDMEHPQFLGALALTAW